MFAIRTNNNSVSKRRRKVKVVGYSIIILGLAIGLPLLVNSWLNQPDGELPAEISTQVDDRINELTETTNELQSADESTNKTAASSDATATSTTATPPAEEATATADTATTVPLVGQAVPTAAGYTVTIPNNWYYSFINEGDYQSLNFGSQYFGPDNPYTVNMTGDIYGYIVPANAIPSEAIGPLVSADSLTTAQGKTIEKKSYVADVPDVGEVTQLLYRFAVGDTEYGLVFYAASSNTEPLATVDSVVGSLILP